MREGEPNFYQPESDEVKETQEPNFKVERIVDLDEETLKQIAEVETSCFPEQMAEDEEELREVLENKNGIHLKIEDQKGVFGYISSVEHSQEFNLLKKADPDLQNEDNALYIHSFDIAPEKRDLKVFNKAWNMLREEAQKQGYKKLTMYARTSNNLSNILQKRYGAKFFRQIKNWRELGEDLDYLEVDLQEK